MNWREIAGLALVTVLVCGSIGSALIVLALLNAGVIR